MFFFLSIGTCNGWKKGILNSSQVSRSSKNVPTVLPGQGVLVYKPDWPISHTRLLTPFTFWLCQLWILRTLKSLQKKAFNSKSLQRQHCHNKGCQNICQVRSNLKIVSIPNDQWLHTLFNTRFRTVSCQINNSLANLCRHIKLQQYS